MVVPESQDKMYYPPDDLQRDAHVPDFNSYLAVYRKSLENPEGRSNTSVFLVQLLQCFHLASQSEPVCIQCLFVFICSLILLITLTLSITLFQLSGRRLLMTFFGRSQQQDQCCSTTLMWLKETFMSNAWKGPKPTYAIISWTGMWERGTSVKRLPITGKLWWEILPRVMSGIPLNSNCSVPCDDPSGPKQTSTSASQCQCFNLQSKGDDLKGFVEKLPKLYITTFYNLALQQIARVH